MIRNLGYLAAGVAVGLVLTGLIVNKEIRDQKEREGVQEGADGSLIDEV